MQTIIEIGKFLFENGPALITAIMAILGGLVAFFLVIPGEQPEKTLQRVVDFLSRFSRK